MVQWFSDNWEMSVVAIVVIAAVLCWLQRLLTYFCYKGGQNSGCSNCHLSTRSRSN